MRDDEVLKLGMSAARLVVCGERYEPMLARGLERILKADGGVGVIIWHLRTDGAGGPVGAMTLASTDPLPPEALESAIAVASRHPSFSSPDLFRPHAERVSDRVRIQEFWDTDVWWGMHGHSNESGRYPAAAELGRHGDVVVFAAMHRRHRDFDDDDMELLEALTLGPLVPALAFQHAWDRATRAMQSWVASTQPPDPITRREAQVLAMVGDGLTNRRIGHQLGISERTVRMHLENINDKLGTVNRTSAVNRWRRGLDGPAVDGYLGQEWSPERGHADMVSGSSRPAACRGR